MENKIIVRLKEDVRPFITRFIINKQADIKALEMAFKGKDYKVIREIAHRMQGASSMYGIDVLADVCTSLIQAARARDDGEVERKISELSLIISELEITYE